MTKKDIKQLAKDSYTQGTLDEKKVSRIASLVDRKTLKAYIRAIKLLEQEKNVHIALADINGYNKSDFEKMFADKNITITQDPSLLLGLRVTQNDLVYDMSLQSRIQSEVLEIKQKYE